MNSNFDANYTLTRFDKENWWQFLIEQYPANYSCAQTYYYENEDPDLELEGCCPKNFRINDYFTICELPRITALKGIISVNGVPVKRYDGYDEWKRKRIYFDKLKKTDIFKAWKKAQYKCQDGKCAWCRCDIELYDKNTHVDHVIPLIYDGTNDFKNLVLACRCCNKNKGAKASGYNDGMKCRRNNSVPKWIKNNYYNDYSLPKNIEISDDDYNGYDNKENYSALDLSGIPF
jgi:5-methylcytosine-specific restriction endonuclease McrA